MNTATENTEILMETREAEEIREFTSSTEAFRFWQDDREDLYQDYA